MAGTNGRVSAINKNNDDVMEMVGGMVGVYNKIGLSVEKIVNFTFCMAVLSFGAYAVYVTRSWAPVLFCSGLIGVMHFKR